jgi:uncharacterized membrane protein
MSDAVGAVVSLHPILDAPWLAKFHVLSAASALVLAPVPIVAPRRPAGRMLGWAWAGLAGAAAVTGAVLQQRGEGPDYGALTETELFLLAGGVALPFALWAARTRPAAVQRGALAAAVAGALLTAGLAAVPHERAGVAPAAPALQPAAARVASR